jgi:hypothetical protein
MSALFLGLGFLLGLLFRRRLGHWWRTTPCPWPMCGYRLPQDRTNWEGPEQCPACGRLVRQMRPDVRVIYRRARPILQENP